MRDSEGEGEGEGAPGEADAAEASLIERSFDDGDALGCRAIIDHGGPGAN